MRKVFIILVVLWGCVAAGSAARAEESSSAIRGDDGSPIANHRIPAELSSSIERLPGIVSLGNQSGVVTLFEFYDLNCPYCRKAAPRIRQAAKQRKKEKFTTLFHHISVGAPLDQRSDRSTTQDCSACSVTAPRR
jgi:hypothetical protein